MFCNQGIVVNSETLGFQYLLLLLFVCLGALIILGKKDTVENVQVPASLAKHEFPTMEPILYIYDYVKPKNTFFKLHTS